MKTTLALLLCLTLRPALAERQPFERYQSIVDRQMFGALPPDFDPTKLPSEVQKSSAGKAELTKEQAQIRSAVHFSVLDVRPNGDVVVGFTDSSEPKSPRNYFLKVGESRDGWTVKEADPQAATMMIEKDGVEVSLSLGGDSAKGAGTTARAPSASPAAARPNSLFARRSLRRLRQAEADEQEKKAKEAAAAREAEREAQAAADKAQREAERAEQRQELQAIRDELRRAREEAEAKAKAVEKEAASEGRENESEEN